MIFSIPALRIVLRGLTIGFGIFAILWGTNTFSVFWKTSNSDTIAARIVAGEPFKAETLLGALAAKADAIIDGRARFLRSLAIIRLRLTELHTAESDDHKPIPSEMATLETSVTRALAREPADPYLWVVLSSLRMAKQGVTEASLAPLRLSYMCGAHEGWIAVVRNRFAMNHFADLPKTVQDATLAEFRMLVASGYAKQTAEIFVGPGWPLHERLLTEIQTVSEDAKHQFAMALHTLNDLIVVPGVIYSDHRHNI